MSEKEVKKILLRIPDSLWKQLQTLADQEFRSINGQIEFLLQEAVRSRNKSKRIPNNEKSTEP